MAFANVRIVMHGHGGRGEVFVDGQKINGVRGVAFTAGMDEANKVTIELLAERIEMEGVADVSTFESQARELKVGPVDAVKGEG